MEIRLSRGDSRKVYLRLRDLFNKEMLDLSEYPEIYFTVKRKTSDPDSSILVSKSTQDGSIVVTDAVNGVALIDLRMEDTALEPRKYKFDIRCVKRDGQNNILEVVSNFDDPGDYVIRPVVKRQIA